MNKEELIEEGIILKSENGIAEVGLLEKAECEECSAKLFCTPGENKNKILEAYDPYNAIPGDSVKISVAGSAVLKATVILYGIPLILLISSLIIGMQFFISLPVTELLAFLLGLVIMAVYYTGVYIIGKKNIRKSYLPKIISIQKQ